MPGPPLSISIPLFPSGSRVTLRPARPEDDAALARLIRSVMTEYGATGPGFSIMDPEVDRMCETYSRPRHAYWVVEHENRIRGGAGYGPLAGAEDPVCELRKMYFYPDLRGLGLGRRLLHYLLDRAGKDGFTHCYLESLSRMKEAERLYRSAGFVPLDHPMGCTGHSACDTYFLKVL